MHGNMVWKILVNGNIHNPGFSSGKIEGFSSIFPGENEDEEGSG